MMSRHKRFQMDGLQAKLAEVTGEHKRMRDGLQWVADQHCERSPYGEGGAHICGESGDCLTEWCLACFAEVVLSGAEDRPSEASQREAASAKLVVDLAMERDEARRRESAAADLVAQLHLEWDEARDERDEALAALWALLEISHALNSPIVQSAAELLGATWDKSAVQWVRLSPEAIDKLAGVQT